MKRDPLFSYAVIISLSIVCASTTYAATLTPVNRDLKATLDVPGPPGNGWARTDFLPFDLDMDINSDGYSDFGDHYVGEAGLTASSGHLSQRSISFTTAGECSVSASGPNFSYVAVSRFTDYWWLSVDSAASFNVSGSVTLGNEDSGVIFQAHTGGAINGVSSAIMTFDSNGSFNQNGTLAAGQYLIRVLGQSLAHAQPGQSVSVPPFNVNAILSVAQVATWSGPSGNWSDMSKWSSNPSYPNNNLPTGSLFDVTLNSGEIYLDVSPTLSSLTLAGGTIAINLASDNFITVTNANGLTLNAGAIQIANVPNTPASLGYYKIIQYTGAIQGAGISSLTLPATADDITYSLDLTTNPGFITLHRGFLGDADDSGTVNFNDFIALANNYLQPDKSWSGGDFNNDHITNFNDFIILANNYGQSITGQNFVASADEIAALNAFAASAAAVPEPASLTLLGLGALGLLRRTRSRVTA